MPNGFRDAAGKSADVTDPLPSCERNTALRRWIQESAVDWGKARAAGDRRRCAQRTARRGRRLTRGRAAGFPIATSATARAAIASPAPIAPSPSIVRALMPTRIPRRRATPRAAPRMAGMCGASLGCSARMVTSTLPIRSPRCAHERHDLAEQHGAVDAAVARIGVGEVLADVAGRQRRRAAHRRRRAARRRRRSGRAARVRSGTLDAAQPQRPARAPGGGCPSPARPARGRPPRARRIRTAARRRPRRARA